jgi:hypothetical protein
MISAFGLAVELGFPIPELDGAMPAPDAALLVGPGLRIELAGAAELDAAWSGSLTPPVVGRAVVDGSSWEAERGQAGDIRMAHALGRFHIDSGATRMRCAPTDLDAPAWRRLLLDTALVTASLARGRDALHAGCVVSRGTAIAIAGASGTGKTTLLLELLRSGARFLADDVVALEPNEDGVLALPGPPVANFPACEPADELADRLHRLSDEWWVRIREPDQAPRPLGVVLVLEPTGPGSDLPPVSRVEAKAGPLLRHALHSGARPDRLERRFAVLSRLAAGAEVIEVRVDRTRPVGELIDRVMEAVPLLQA